MTLEEWEKAMDQVWKTADEMGDEALRAEVARLADEYPGDDGAGLFEVAGSWDSTDRSDQAIALYREALKLGLRSDRRRRAVIQMASSLRNVGEAEEAERLLRDELASGSDDLDHAVVAFLALTLADLGRDREALAITLEALAPHLVRYTRSVTWYAQDLGRV